MIRAVVVLSLLSSSLSSRALADSPVAPIANTGLELMGGDGTFQVASRSHVGLVGTVPAGPAGKVQPSIGFGVTFGYGTLSTGDPRALDGSVTIGYLDYGPELHLGLAFGESGTVRDRLFASFAYLKTDLDDRLMLDPVGGIGGTRGMRVTVGGSWARTWGRGVADGAHHESLHDDDGRELDWLLLLLVPQQLELGWERSAGSDRFGVTFSYGI